MNYNQYLETLATSMAERCEDKTAEGLAMFMRDEQMTDEQLADILVASKFPGIKPPIYALRETIPDCIVHDPNIHIIDIVVGILKLNAITDIACDTKLNAIAGIEDVNARYSGMMLSAYFYNESEDDEL